ncbi:MAG TPA: zinc ribbon domain-containing protein [Fimbriimonadaceae bacterium]|nr:zinc ribbon domain-containing protein [Fimbriimonadaceae bacterium]
MPIYEYEPDDHDCLMCDGRVEVIQSMQDEPLRYCPHCGLNVRRIVSRASFKFDKASPDQAAKQGFTTYRRSGRGVWEKVAGEGADAIVREDRRDAPDEP